MKAYRFFDKDSSGQIVSKRGNQKWKLGKWSVYKSIRRPQLCRTGLHASPTIFDAVTLRQGDFFGIVEARLITTDPSYHKFTCRAMKLIKFFDAEYYTDGLLRLKFIINYLAQYNHNIYYAYENYYNCYAMKLLEKKSEQEVYNYLDVIKCA